MPQFCIVFYANYTILETQRGSHSPLPPPKYAPACAITRTWPPFTRKAFWRNTAKKKVLL